MSLDEIMDKLRDIDYTGSVKLDACTTVTDIRTFINSHEAILRANSGKKQFMPYYNRLLKFTKLWLQR